jgi:acyl dehydratase
MATGIIHQIGTTLTLTKVISEADVALFTLVTTDQPPASTDEPLAAEPAERAPVPGALVIALLVSAAAQHVAGTTLARADVTCTTTAWTGDALTASTEVVAYDAASGILRIHVWCANQDGQRLAEGMVDLRAGA